MIFYRLLKLLGFLHFPVHYIQNEFEQLKRHQELILSDYFY